MGSRFSSYIYFPNVLAILCLFYILLLLAVHCVSQYFRHFYDTWPLVLGRFWGHPCAAFTLLIWYLLNNVQFRMHLKSQTHLPFNIFISWLIVTILYWVCHTIENCVRTMGMHTWRLSDHVNVLMHTYTYIHTHTHTYVQTHTHTYIHIYTHAFMHAYIRT